MKYRSDIDGLRAVGILFVLAFHAFPEVLKNGFIGVDIFFVISGFLITAILSEDLQQKKFNLITFYFRRIKRIFPMALVVLLACGIAGALTFFEPEFLNLKQEITAAAGFYMNYLVPENSGYFSIDSRYRTLLHFWSLAIEEQFYLFWPVLAWILYSIKKSKGLLLTGVLIVFAGSLVLFISTEKFYYFSLLCRVWELALGGIGALVLKTRLKSRIDSVGLPLSILSFALLIGLFFVTDDRLAIAMAVLASFLFLIAPQFATPKRFLNSPALNYIGKMSYSLYLWHWPILAFARIYNPKISNSATLALVVLIFALSILSYSSVERFFKRLNFDIVRGNHFKNAKSVLAVALLSFSMYGLFAWTRFIVKPADSVINNHYSVDESTLKVSAECLLDPPFANQHQLSWCMQEPVKSVQGIFLGDSHAHAIYLGMVGEKTNVSWQLIAKHSCVPYLIGLNDHCEKIITETYAKIKVRPEVAFMIFSMANRVFTEHKNLFESEAARKNAISAIKELAQAHKRIVLLRPVPEIADNIFTCAFQRFPFLKSYDTSELCSISLTEWKRDSKDFNTFLDLIKEKVPEVLIIDPASEVCNNDKCYTAKKGNLLYDDKDHLSYLGAKLVSRNIIQNLSERANSK